MELYYRLVLIRVKCQNSMYYLKLFKILNKFSKNKKNIFQVCQKLKSIDSSKLEDEEILYYYATMSFGGCKIAENDKVFFFKL